MDNTNSIGEAQITPQVMQQVTPDMMTPQGGQQLFQHLAKATQQKDMLDFIFKGIAQKAGADFSSRVKNPQTVVQKIAQKRMQGRDYNVQDINDAYGGRFIVQNKRDIEPIKNMLNKAADLGIIKINKKQDVTKDTYHAYHIDFETPQGTKGEAQIMTPQEELESVANHSLRAVFGEKQPDQVQHLKEMQANKVSSMGNNKAHAIAKSIQAVASQTNNQPLDPRLIASMLKTQ